MKIIITVMAVVFGLSGAAFAGKATKTAVLTDEQMDQIVGGNATIEIYGVGNFSAGGTVVLANDRQQLDSRFELIPAPNIGFKGQVTQSAKPSPP